MSYILNILNPSVLFVEPHCLGYFESSGLTTVKVMLGLGLPLSDVIIW